MSLRPEPQSSDLFSRIYSSSSTAESLEILSRRGMVPLFVGNKPIEDAGREVQQVNTFRKEEGLPPCQPKNVMFMYCTTEDAGQDRGVDLDRQPRRHRALRIRRRLELQGRQGL